MQKSVQLQPANSNDAHQMTGGSSSGFTVEVVAEDPPAAQSVEVTFTGSGQQRPGAPNEAMEDQQTTYQAPVSKQEEQDETSADKHMPMHSNNCVNVDRHVITTCG